MREETELAIKAAKEAGKILMENFGKKKSVRYKGKKDLVTNVDLEAEKKIIDIITKKYPDHSILAEERGEVNKESDYTWFIDPLDGTHNYFFGYPFFGVSIALRFKEEVILGVIYLPCFNQLFYAEKGKGAFLNNKKIHVSSRSLKESLLLYDSGFPEKAIDEMLKYFRRLVIPIFNVRLTGAAVVSHVFVAMGVGDLYIEFSNKPWDNAAGFLIVEEAGGRVTDFKGNKHNPYLTAFIASNGKIHDEVLKIINEV